MSNQAKSVRSLTRDTLKSEFGSFKRNPGQPLSHRSSVINQFAKMYKNNMILGRLNKKIQLNQLDDDDTFSVQTPKSYMDQQRPGTTGNKTASSTRGFMHLRNSTMLSQKSLPKSS